MPRAGVAISSPNGVTRFCSATSGALLVWLLVHRLGGGRRIGGRKCALQSLLKLPVDLFLGQITRQRLVLLAAHVRLHPHQMGARAAGINPAGAALAQEALSQR